MTIRFTETDVERIAAGGLVLEPWMPDTVALRVGSGLLGIEFRWRISWLQPWQAPRYPESEPDYPGIWRNWGLPPDERNRQPWDERIDMAGP